MLARGLSRIRDSVNMEVNAVSVLEFLPQHPTGLDIESVNIMGP